MTLRGHRRRRPAMNRTMMMFALVPSLGFLVTCAAGCGSSSGGGGGSGSTSAPVTSSAPPSFRSLDRGTRTGLQLQVEDRRVVTDNAAFAVLWLNHAGASATRPAVDFAREQVAALFLGPRPTDGWGIEVVGVADVGSGSGVEVQYQRQAPGGSAAPG